MKQFWILATAVLFFQFGHVDGPSGKVSQDIISLADPHATFTEIAGVKLPDNLQFDGRSFAPQLLGKPGTPREWAYVQLGQKWFVREAGFKMNDAKELFDPAAGKTDEGGKSKKADAKKTKKKRKVAD